MINVNVISLKWIGHLEWRVSSSVVIISCPRKQLHGLWIWRRFLVFIAVIIVLFAHCLAMNKPGSQVVDTQRKTSNKHKISDLQTLDQKSYRILDGILYQILDRISECVSDWILDRKFRDT